jgi:hypothetical protein
MIDPNGDDSAMKTLTLPTISCPACRCKRVHRADYEGIVEQTVLRIFNICPLLCRACDMRFYMFLVESPIHRPESLHSWLDAERCKTILSSN